MKPQTIEEKVQWYALLHKQNLNGRESEDELFEAGILAGIEETEELRDEFAIEFAEWLGVNNYKKYSNGWANLFTKATTEKELLQIFKKEKGL